MGENKNTGGPQRRERHLLLMYPTYTKASDAAFDLIEGGVYRGLELQIRRTATGFGLYHRTKISKTARKAEPDHDG